MSNDLSPSAARFILDHTVYLPGIKDLTLAPTRFECLGLLHQGVCFNSLVPYIEPFGLPKAYAVFGANHE